MARCSKVRVVVPTQVWGELYNVISRAGATREQARRLIVDLRQTTQTAPVTAQVIESALDTVTSYKLQIWDCIILHASIEAGCELLIGEGMHDGFRLGRLTVVNPFKSELHPKLKALLKA